MIGFKAQMTGRITKKGVEGFVSRAGKDFSKATISVHVERKKPDAEDYPKPAWFKVMASGWCNDDLAACEAGDTISVAGNVTRDTWTNKEGEEMVFWTIFADQVMCVRPRQDPDQHEPQNADYKEAAAPAGGGVETDDDIPF